MDNAQEAPVSTCPVPFCGKEFKDYRSVYRHLARVHRLNNDDPIWQQHSRDFGGNKPRASCPWCANTFRNLSVHKKTCHQCPAVEPPPTLASTRGLPPEKQQLVVDLLGGDFSRENIEAACQRSAEFRDLTTAVQDRYSNLRPSLRKKRMVQVLKDACRAVRERERNEMEIVRWENQEFCRTLLLDLLPAM